MTELFSIVLNVPGIRDELLVLLRFALKGEEVPVAAIVVAREFAASRGTRFVDGAAAFVCVEKLADLAEVHVFLALHHALVAFDGLEEFLFGFFQGQAEVIGNALGIAVLNFDDRI